MSKEAWFDNYERLYNEREAGEIEGSDEDLADLATEEERDQHADQADNLSELRKANDPRGRHL